MPSEPSLLAFNMNWRPGWSVIVGGSSSPTKSRRSSSDVAGLEADVVAREQRVEPGNAAQRDPRLDDPELRVVDHQASRVLGDLRLDDHLGIVVRELHRSHLPDPHVLVLDESLAGLDAFGSLEFDRDAGPLAANALNRDADGHQRSENRNDPDDRDPPCASCARWWPAAVDPDRFRQPWEAAACGLVASQISRGSKASAASIVSTTTAAKNSTPVPGATDISGWSCTSATVKRVDEHVEHRPSADELHHAIESRALVAARDRAALHGDQEIDERHELPERDHHARDQHDQRERPRSRRVEKRHSAQDRVALGGSQRGRVQHRQHVGRDVADGRGDDERPGRLDRAAGGGIRALRRNADRSRARSRSQVATAVGRPRTTGVPPARRSRMAVVIPATRQRKARDAAAAAFRRRPTRPIARARDH